jgi:hypothetical protein
MAAPPEFDDARLAVAEGRPDEAIQLLTRELVAEHPSLAPEFAALLRITEGVGAAAALLESPGDEVLTHLYHASYRDYADATAESFRHLEAIVGAGFESDQDDGVRARAQILRAELCWTRGRYGAMATVLSGAMASAEKVPDAASRKSLTNSIRRWQRRADLLGPAPADEAIARCDADPGSDASVRAVVAAVKGGVKAMKGETDAADAAFGESAEIGNHLGDWLAALPLYRAPAKLLSGDPAEAERDLREGVAKLRTREERSRAETANAFLAHALCAQGKFDDGFWNDADAVPQSRDDVYTQALWKSAQAWRLAKFGYLAALDLARPAIADADTTDGLNLQGDTRLAFAEAVLLLPDRPGRDEAVQLVRDARDRYAAKGNDAAVPRAESLLALLS